MIGILTLLSIVFGGLTALICYLISKEESNSSYIELFIGLFGFLALTILCTVSLIIELGVIK